MLLIINKKKLLHIIITILSLVVVIFLLFETTNALIVNTTPKGYIAIIIDDFGNNSEGSERMLDLDIPLTVAVMPFLPSSEKDAYLAHGKGLDVIMHVPMEPVNGRPEWLGPNAITINLSNEQIKKRIRNGLDELKYSIGMNNHMGSKVTQDNRVVKAVLEVAKERKIIFIDSKTTPKSVIEEESTKLGLISLNRDIFLDNVKEKSYIKNQLIKLSEIASKRGYAIGIGHVGIEGGTVTADAIKEIYPLLIKNGIKFVLVSDIKEIVKK